MIRGRWRRWLWWCACLALVFGGAQWVSAQAPSGAVGFYYIGEEGPVAEALRLAEPYFVRVDRPELAQVYVLNDPTGVGWEELRTYGQQVQREAVGLVLFCGPHFPTEAQTSELQALLGVSTFGLKRIDTPRVLLPSASQDPLQSAVTWTSAPALSARTVISNPNLLRSIVVTTAGEPVVQRIRARETTQVFVVGAWLDDPSNAAWQRWPYFDYLIYRLLAEAANSPRVLSFAAYPRAPLPRGAVRWAFSAGGALVIVAALATFFFIRRLLFLRPHILEQMRVIAVMRLPAQEWDVVGFHRPLAGFLYLLMVGVWLFIPLLGFRLYGLPELLLPWPEALDFWAWAARWLAVVWVAFDLGIGLAAVRYFAALQLNNPRESFRYLQFYVWWQFISGAIQLGVIALLAAQVFPQTALAHLSFYFVAQAVIQFPGFLQVFGLFFRSIQRFDQEQRLTLALALAEMICTTLLIVLMRRWGAARGDIGETLGGILGLGLGLYLARWLTFGLGAWLYRRLGYGFRPLFLPAFDRWIAQRMLSFGARLAVGDLAAPLGYLAEGWLLLRLFPGYGELQSAWLLALTFTVAYNVLGKGLYNGLMPALTESYIQEYRSLTRYYMSQAVRYGMWFSAFAVAGLSAVGDRFMVGVLGPDAARAAALIGPLAFIGALQWPAWSVERLLEAAGRPLTRSWVQVGEVVARVGLLALFVPLWQEGGILVAYAVALALRSLAGWLLAGRLVLWWRVYIWQTFVAPVGAGLLVYNLLCGLGDLSPQPTPLVGTLLLLAALYPALLLYGLFTALLGGWDTGGLAELKQAARLCGAMRPLAGFFYRVVELGALSSPLHNRFPLLLRELAEEEASALTLRRKRLV